MYKYIEEKEKFRDLHSDLAKDNYKRIMSILDSVTIPNIRNLPYISLTSKTLNKIKFDGFVHGLCGKVFFDENNRLALELANNRMELDFKGYPYGFTSNDLNKEHLIIIEGCKYYISPIIAIHELTHAISFITSSRVPKQYEEVLSIFNEMKAKTEMDGVIQDEWLFNKIIERLKYRIYIKDLQDEAIKNLKLDEDLYFQGYFRVLNFVYALRLYELYTMFPEEIDTCVDSILRNEGSIIELLEKYQINLENEDTILAFEKIIAEYEQVVCKHFNKNRNRIQ